MAIQYDQPTSAEDINNAMDSNPSLTPETKEAINQVLGIETGSETVNVAAGTYDPATQTITFQVPGDQAQALVLDLSNVPAGTQIPVTLPEALRQANVVIIDSDAGVILTFNTVERVIVADKGNDVITVNGDRNTTLDGGAGNDSLVTTGGNDSITGGDGNDTISSGAGNDTINSGAGNDSINAGSGNDSIVTGTGNDTVDAGTGFDQVTLSVTGASTKTVVGGALVITEGATSVTVDNAEFLTFSNGAIMTVSGDAMTAAAMRLYEVVLGRSADAYGADYWATKVASGQMTLGQLGDGFVNSAEFAMKNPGGLSNQAFVEQLYLNGLNRASDAGGLQHWTQMLDNGATRGEVAALFAVSIETIAVNETTVMQIDGWV